MPSRPVIVPVLKFKHFHSTSLSTHQGARLCGTVEHLFSFLCQRRPAPIRTAQQRPFNQLHFARSARHWARDSPQHTGSGSESPTIRRLLAWRARRGTLLPGGAACDGDVRRNIVWGGGGGATVSYPPCACQMRPPGGARLARGSPGIAGPSVRAAAHAERPAPGSITGANLGSPSSQKS